MLVLDVVAASAQLLADVLFAHDLGYPHQEQTKADTGGAPVVAIVAGVVLTLVLVGALIWVRERMRAADEERAEPPAGAGG